MTALKLMAAGNSVGGIFPKKVLAKLGAKKGDLLYVSPAPDGELRLSACDPDVAE